MFFCKIKKDISFENIRIGTNNEIYDLKLVTKNLLDPTGKIFEGENVYLANNAWFFLQGVVLHVLYQKKYHNFKVNADGKREFVPGRIANISDVLDFLYDYQDVAESDLEAKHRDFLARVKYRGRTFSFNASGFDGGADEEEMADAIPHNEDRFFNEMGNSQLSEYFTENLDSIQEPAIVDENESPSDDNVGENKDKDEAGSGDGSSSAEAENEPKLKTLDGDIIGGDGDDEAAGLEGFQKKIKKFITDYRFAMRKNEAGEWEDYAAPYCHAPDDDKDLFTRLYPDKVSREGLHPHVRQIFQAMIDKPDKEFGSIMSTLDTALIIYRNPVLVKNISESDLVMKDLMDCDKPISL